MSTVDCVRTTPPTWERYRKYLALLARRKLGTRLLPKVDLSGVVQQTLLEAHQNQNGLEGCTGAEQVAWLRRVMTNNLTDEVRRFTTAARDARRERPLDRCIEESSEGFSAGPAAVQSSPSQRVIRKEQLLELAAALELVPQDQRTAVELRHFEGLSVAEIARRMDRTPPAVSSLLVRGLKRLREVLAEAEQGYPACGRRRH